MQAVTGPSAAQAHEAGSAVYRLIDAESARTISKAEHERAKGEAEKFLQLLENLSNLLRARYPPHLIAVIAGWGLRTAIGPSGARNKPLIAGISQHHAELLQAIAAMLPATEWGREPAEPEDIQQTIDTIIGLARSFASRRLVASTQVSDPQETMKLALQERLRMHTQTVRNWGPYGTMLQILRELYAPLDASTRAHHGFGVLGVIAVAEHTVAVIEVQVNERFQLLKDIFRARTIPDLVRDFFARYPGVTGDPDELLASFHPEETLETVRARLISHADRWLVINSTVPVVSVAEACGLTEPETRKVLDRLSLRPGELKDANPEHLFLSNPVWTRPGLNCGGEFFFPFPQTVVSFLHQILLGICEEAIPEALFCRRSVYLEHKTHEIIKKALPGAVVTPGAKWRWEDTDYETDVLAVLDRTILIAECKSHSLSPSGLRGAPDRVRRHVRELIADASVQSSRLERVIALARDGDLAAVAVATELGLRPAEIDTVIRISVTLDDLTVLASAEGDMKVAEWVQQDLDLAPTLNIADLVCVAEFLSRPSQFLYYFHRRARMQKAADVFGFELDFLGLYLATNFFLPASDGKYRLVIAGMSQDIDLYYQNLEIGRPYDKPTPQMHPFIGDFVEHLENRRPRGWTTMVRYLLSIGDVGDQANCAEALEDMRRLVERSPVDSDQPHALVYTPEVEPDLVILFNVELTRERARNVEAMSGLVNQAFAVSGRSRCLFVGRSVKGWNSEPYDLVGIAGL